MPRLQCLHTHVLMHLYRLSDKSTTMLTHVLVHLYRLSAKSTTMHTHVLMHLYRLSDKSTTMHTHVLMHLCQEHYRLSDFLTRALPCTHMFSCTCTDFLTRALPCKHIHAVQIGILDGTLKDTEKNTPPQEDMVSECVYNADIAEPKEKHSNSSAHTDSKEYFKRFICMQRLWGKGFK